MKKMNIRGNNPSEKGSIKTMKLNKTLEISWTACNGCEHLFEYKVSNGVFCACDYYNSYKKIPASCKSAKRDSNGDGMIVSGENDYCSYGKQEDTDG